MPSVFWHCQPISPHPTTIYIFIHTSSSCCSRGRGMFRISKPGFQTPSCLLNILLDSSKVLCSGEPAGFLYERPIIFINFIHTNNKEG